MHCTASKDLKVNAPAIEVWPIFGMLKMEKFFTKYLTHIIRKAEVLEGDGRVGTILKLVFTPGLYEFDSHIERYTKVDMENRVFEAEVTEGGYLDMGFTSFLYRAEVIETSPKSCIIRVSIEYEVNKGIDMNVALPGLQFLVKVANVVSNFALNNQ